MGINATSPAEKMLGHMGMELIAAKPVCPFDDGDLREGNSTHNRRAAAAQRAITPARINNTIGQIEHQFDIATMTDEAMSRQNFGRADPFDHAEALKPAPRGSVYIVSVDKKLIYIRYLSILLAHANG